jgi:hypothetical protein
MKQAVEGDLTERVAAGNDSNQQYCDKGAELAHAGFLILQRR